MRATRVQNQTLKNGVLARGQVEQKKRQRISPEPRGDVDNVTLTCHDTVEHQQRRRVQHPSRVHVAATARLLLEESVADVSRSEIEKQDGKPRRLARIKVVGKQRHPLCKHGCNVVVKPTSSPPFCQHPCFLPLRTHQQQHLSPLDKWYQCLITITHVQSKQLKKNQNPLCQAHARRRRWRSHRGHCDRRDLCGTCCRPRPRVSLLVVVCARDIQCIKRIAYVSIV